MKAADIDVTAALATTMKATEREAAAADTAAIVRPQIVCGV